MRTFSCLSSPQAGAGKMGTASSEGPRPSGFELLGVIHQLELTNVMLVLRMSTPAIHY